MAMLQHHKCVDVEVYFDPDDYVSQISTDALRAELRRRVRFGTLLGPDGDIDDSAVNEFLATAKEAVAAAQQGDRLTLTVMMGRLEQLATGA